MSWKGGGAEPANMVEINAAFEKAHPDIELDFSYVLPNDVYQQKPQSQLLAGNAADVIMVNGDLPIGVYVNLDILAEAGITAPPTDFPAFLDALGKLRTAGQPGYSFPNAQGSWPSS